jgi:glycogen phosphorylase
MDQPNGDNQHSNHAAVGELGAGLDVEALKQTFISNLFCVQGRSLAAATRNDCYMALAYTVRDRLLERWIRTRDTYFERDVRMVCYLSAEFLTGPHLENNLINLRIYNDVRQAMEQLGLDLEELINQEEEPGLGNGGLGRLAACFLDSLATFGIPAVGYGIRYEFGMFDQQIRDGWQVEVTDKWLRLGNPWEIARPEGAVVVKLGGHTEMRTDESGREGVHWVPSREVKGVPYDTPVLGYGTNTANTLRLWMAEAVESFDFEAFNTGDYMGAVANKIVSENISKVLYPNDDKMQGKQLRLEQQYFFTSCSLQDIVRIHLRRGRPLEELHEKWAVQLNDTHPSIGIAELMRLLVDEHGMDWEIAWGVTQRTFSYTNHTLLPEALERWPLPLFRRLLPRHMEIICDINERFLDEVRARYPGDEDRVRRMSLIDDSGEGCVRMAHLAAVGSHTINGVAALHTELLKSEVLRDFCDLWPERFQNVTNGVTPRRWLVVSNPKRSALVTSRIGPGWITDLDQLRQLEAFADDSAFLDEWRRCRWEAKCRLGAYIQSQTSLTVDPESLFDVQVKRIHEYKRQHLNLLHIVTLYWQLRENPHLDITPRTFIFGGKAAPGYFMAKLIIKLINSVGEVVNGDPNVKGRLRVVFLPDYNVTIGQRVYPAADLSEQIPTAGKEASGTGNMKLAMNGALTIGTLDGANIEIREEVGAENFFLFGLTEPEVCAHKANGYDPRRYYETNAGLREAIDSIARGHFSGGDRELFRPLVDSLLDRDEYLLLADYQSYVDCQNRVSQAYRDTERWGRMSLLNAARTGKFSSDRSIQEYCARVWRTGKVEIDLDRR